MAQNRDGKAAPAGERIVDADIARELGEAYLSYSMSVIVGRALPDVRDGLKPVHRRILHAMREGGYTAGKAPRKSARIVGDVMGQYHPHGDAAIYEAMVRMAQDFSMSLPLIDGQGNFGSVDGDPPAAMRYTEARTARAAEPLLDEIGRDTVDWIPNYDGETNEPTVLPAAYPNLLINGSEGIAVGMATRIPPHNPGEAIRAAIALLKDPEAGAETVREHMPAPDFPTGGVVMGRDAIRKAMEHGRGTFAVRARHHFEDAAKGRKAVVFTELPFQVNKAKVVERVSELVREKHVEGVHEVRDESDRNGIRLVVETKRDTDPEVVLARLHKTTQLRTSFSVNALALDAGGRPRQMDAAGILRAFLDFRRETVRRRTLHELRRDRARAHTVSGFLVALANVDAVVDVIRNAGDADEAARELTARDFPAADLADLITRADPKSKIDTHAGTCRLTDAQAGAVLDLRLHRLTGLERGRLEEESRELVERVARAVRILSDDRELSRQVRRELERTLKHVDRPRRTEIVEDDADWDAEDLIPREDVVVTVTRNGYVKRVALSEYGAQARNGKGRSGMATRDDDVVDRVITTSTHAPLLIFTDRGTVHEVKVHRLPRGGPRGLGRPIANLLPRLADDEGVAAVVPVPEDPEARASSALAFVTELGSVRRNALVDFTGVPSSGKTAMKLRKADGTPRDRLVDVLVHGEDQHLMLTTRGGQVVRFAATDVRLFSSRNSTGVRGVRLREGDAVVSAVVLDDPGATPEEASAFLSREKANLDRERRAELRRREQMVLVVTETGMGRRTSAHAYPVIQRGGVGVRDRPTKRDVGAVSGTAVVGRDMDVVLVTDRGRIIRTPAADIRRSGRGTAGVHLLRLEAGERVVGFSVVESDGSGQRKGDADARTKDHGNDDEDDAESEGE